MRKQADANAVANRRRRKTGGVSLLLLAVSLTVLVAGCGTEAKSGPVPATAAESAGQPANQRPAYRDAEQMFQAFADSYNKREYDKVTGFFSAYYWDNNPYGHANAEALYDSLHDGNAGNPGDYRLAFTDIVDSTHRIGLWISSEDAGKAMLVRALQEDDGNWRVTEYSAGSSGAAEVQAAIVQQAYRTFVSKFNSGDMEAIREYFPAPEDQEWLAKLHELYAPLRYVAGNEANFDRSVMVYDKDGAEHAISIGADSVMDLENRQIYRWSHEQHSVFDRFRGPDTGDFKLDTSMNAETEEYMEIRLAREQPPTEYRQPVVDFLKAFNEGDMDSRAVESFFDLPVQSTARLHSLHQVFAPFDTEIVGEIPERVAIVIVAVDKNGMYHQFVLDYESKKLTSWNSPPYSLDSGIRIYSADNAAKSYLIP